MIEERGNIKEQIRKLKRLNNRVPRIAGTVAVHHIKQSFRNQGFTDQSLRKWKQRKHKGRGRRRAILVKSGALRRSVRITRIGRRSVSVGSELPYAQIHNEGGTIDTVQQVGKHTRKAHKRRRSGRKRRSVQVKEHIVSAHKRKINTKIPRRQFIGRSRKLERKIDLKITTEIQKIFS